MIDVLIWNINTRAGNTFVDACLPHGGAVLSTTKVTCVFALIPLSFS